MGAVFGVPARQPAPPEPDDPSGGAQSPPRRAGAFLISGVLLALGGVALLLTDGSADAPADTTLPWLFGIGHALVLASLVTVGALHHRPTVRWLLGALAVMPLLYAVVTGLGQVAPGWARDEVSGGAGLALLGLGVLVMIAQVSWYVGGPALVGFLILADNPVDRFGRRLWAPGAGLVVLGSGWFMGTATGVVTWSEAGTVAAGVVMALLAGFALSPEPAEPHPTNSPLA